MVEPEEAFNEPREKTRSVRLSASGQRRKAATQEVCCDSRSAGTAGLRWTTLFFGADGRLKSTRVGELSAATLAECLDATAR